jgi:aspartate ammonia-lyase
MQVVCDEPLRREVDMLGVVELPAGALYGVHTLRALANFQRLGPTLGDVSEFCRAFGMVKLAALRANIECGAIDPAFGTYLAAACLELADGSVRLRRSLIVPLLQGGAGTSANMNVNEVLANRTLELTGRAPGEYDRCHPNDHVNRSQSTNDVYPTALRLGLVLQQQHLVMPALASLVSALRSSARCFPGIEKLGRTQLQDAVPMTVDQEIDAWADAVEHGTRLLAVALEDLYEVNLGGTAIGTGLTTPTGYRKLAVAYLAAISGLPMRPARRPVSATTDPGTLIALSSGLRACAVALAKVANDLRLLSSGPRTGLGEYQLPARQAGSSMMPGKVNPVIPEFVAQLSYRIRGLDNTVAMAADGGELQLNAMLPVAADALFEIGQLVACGATSLAERCIAGLEINSARAEVFAQSGLGALTQLAASAGYRAATELAQAQYAERVEPRPVR